MSVTLLRNPFFVAKRQKMSGISAAQYLKKKYGVVIFAKKIQDTTYCIVKQGTDVISQQIDDNFGGLSWLTCYNMFQYVKGQNNLTRNYSVPPSSSFFTPFTVDVVDTFDHEWFVDTVLPMVKGKTNIQGIADEYLTTWHDKFNGDTATRYEVYDWIVRLYVALRRMKWEPKLSAPKDAKIETIYEAIRNLADARYVTFPPGTEDTFLPVLKQVHPNAQEHEGVWYTDPASDRRDPLNLENAPEWFSGLGDPKATYDQCDQDDDQTEVVRATVSANADDLNDTIRKVLHNLTTPHQSLNPEQTAFMTHGGNPDLLDTKKGGVGSGKLRGLGKICGEGPLEDCIDRVYKYLRLSLPNASEGDVYNLAAGRISRMSSEKRPVSTRQAGKIVYSLEKRGG